MLDQSIVEGNSSVKAQESMMKVFAVFGLVNYPLFFILEDVVLNDEFWFRIVAVVLCLGLFCVLKFQNQKFRQFFWFLTVTYCLPFFTTLFFLISNMNITWVVNLILSTFLLIVITSWRMFFLSMCLGGIIGCIIFLCFFSSTSLDFVLLKNTIFNVIWIIGVMLLFNIRRSHIEEKVFKQNILLIKNLRVQNKELSGALEVKRRFLANINHEIRTPVHVVLGVAQAVYDSWSDLTEKKRKELIKLVLEQTTRLSDFVVDILDMSKLLDDDLVFDKTSSNILKVVNEAISEFDASNPEQKFVLSNDAQLDDKCYIDVIRIKQVIRQLISNSIRFGGGGNVISIHISNEIYNLNHHKNKWIKVSVSDCGTGIPVQEQDLVFGVFEESSRTRNNSGGRGLGLAICKKIITEHKGEIWIEQNKPQGTVVSFVVPVD